MNKFNLDAKEIILDNGIKLVSVKKDSQVTSIYIGLKVGSLYENENEKGLSHFIEHMLFKGTNTRNNEKLNKELEEMGGEYNAYTDYECTVYNVTALSEELEKSIELLSDMLQKSTFEKEELEKERGVILSELRISKDDIEELSFNNANKIAFSKSPIRYLITGEEEDIKRYTREDLVNFYKKYYVPNNCYISIVSPFDHEDVLNLVCKYFNDWEKRQFALEDIHVEKNNPVCKVTYKDNIEQSSIVYVFTFHDLSREQELALKIMNNRFGDSSNSMLFRALREDRGLVYDIYTDLDMTKYVKTLYIYTSVSEENIEETLDIINNCIKEIKDKSMKIDNSTIKLMKKVLKTAIALMLGDTSDLSDYILHQMINEETIFKFINDVDDMEKVNTDEIYSVANLVLNNPTIHILRNK